MRTLKFKVQPTNAFFATVNQMFGGSSQPPTTAERAVIKSLCTVQTTKQCSAVVVSWEKPPNIWLTVAKNAFVGRLLNFRVRMLLKSAVISIWFGLLESDQLDLSERKKNTPHLRNSSVRFAWQLWYFFVSSPDSRYPFELFLSKTKVSWNSLPIRTFNFMISRGIISDKEIDVSI